MKNSMQQKFQITQKAANRNWGKITKIFAFWRTAKSKLKLEEAEKQ